MKIGSKKPCERRAKRAFDRAAAERAMASVKRWQEEMRAKGIEPEDLLAEMRLDPLGAPLGRVA